MIPLTRLNGHAITVNSDLVRSIEAAPDTTLTLITGEKLIVLESLADVADAVAHWRAGLLRLAFPDSLGYPAVSTLAASVTVAAHNADHA